VKTPITSGGTIFSGIMSGAGGLTMAGSNVQTLAGANTYTGTTNMSAGTLKLSGTGSIASSTLITVGSGAVLDVTGVTGGANFANGGFALAGGQKLAGDGTVSGPVAVRSGSAVGPGNGVGTLSVGGMTWHGGGRYDFEFASGIGDLLSGTGALDLSALSGSNRFLINVASAGPPQPQTFTIATFAGGVSGFDASGFAFTGLFSGSPNISLSGNSLVLNFTAAPEPAQALLLCAVAAAAAAVVRRQRLACRAVPPPRILLADNCPLTGKTRLAPAPRSMRAPWLGDQRISPPGTDARPRGV
jgi:autotransporter-associated beta strand protein